MIRLELHGDTVRLFSEFHHAEQCKTIPAGTWDKTVRCWTFPVEALTDIAATFQAKDIICEDGVMDALKAQTIKLQILEKTKTGERPLRQHDFLMRHQKICREIANLYPRFALFLDTGTGKTITSLQIIEDKFPHRFLVICPKAIIKSAWVEDQQDFFPGIKLLPLSKNMTKADYKTLMDKWGLAYNGRTSAVEMRRDLTAEAQVFIINPESFKTDIKDINKLGITGLIIDESTTIKNPTSQTTKEVTAFADAMKYVYILSGKPNPNGNMDYFSQMRVVDPAVLGKSFFSFRNRYYTPTGYMGYDFVEKEGAAEDMAKRIARKSIIIAKEDCLDLPEKTYLKRMIDLPTDAKRYYQQMEKTQVLKLDDRTISVPNKLASVMKLRQITSGFVLDEEGGADLHNAKFNELHATLDEIGDKQVIIWCQFKSEIARIEAALQAKGKTVVTAYSQTKNTDESIRQFKYGEAQYIIAHPATLKFGVTFTNCTYAVYFSMSYNFEEYYQSHDRIYRKGQTKPCTFIFLLADGTIDETIYKVVNEKGDSAKLIEELIRRR